MSQFPFARASLSTEDPFKRVKYSLGLVLGVDEFEQEQGYLRGRQDWHQFLLHGAGTVYGLRVEARGATIFVHPGLAVDPLGRLVRVGAAQSANLADWVAQEANRKQLHRPTGKDGSQKLFVVLRHAEEGTDPVAFPGPPERPNERVMLPTRVAETFELAFQAAPPEIAGAKAAVLLGELLSRIEVVDRGPVDEKTMAAEVRALQAGNTSGLASRTLGVSRENLDAVLSAALRTWVTDVLPAQRPGLEQAPAAEGGVLLAQLDLKISEQGQILHVTVDESKRPYLLPINLMQEMLLRRMTGPASGRARLDKRIERALARVDMLMAPPPEEAVAPSAEATPTAEADMEPSDAAPVQVVAPQQVMPFVSVFRDWSSPEPALRLKFHVPALKDGFTVTVQLVVDTMGFGFIRNRPVSVKSLTMLADNLFELVLDERADPGDHFQLSFDLQTMETRNGERLDQLAQAGKTAWLGFDGDHTVTAFCDALRPVTTVVAAGIFRTDGRTQGRNLTAEAERDGICRLTFKGYRKDGIYIVKATPLAGQSERTPQLEVLGGRDETGILTRIVYPENRPVPAEFMVEISCVHTDE